MLKDTMRQGRLDALARLKLAEGMLSTLGQGLSQALIGQPGRLFKEGPAAFRNGGFLSAKNVFWPATSGPGGSKLNWLNRAATIGIPLAMAHRMKNDYDHDSGPMARMLGAAGGIAGMSYGYPALGMLGGPLVGALGSRLGHGVGNLLDG